jgi:hypothetical protein
MGRYRYFLAIQTRLPKEEDASTLEDFREVSNAAAKRAWARRSAELVEASSSRCTKWIPWRAPSVRDPCGSSPPG